MTYNVTAAKSLLATTRAIDTLFVAMNDTSRRLSMGNQLNLAVDAITSCSGKVVFSGIGKSGLVAKKTAATFASTGTPAFFVHGAEASHGDMGMISNQDVVIVESWSGETREMMDLLRYCRKHNITMISITGNFETTFTSMCHINLICPPIKESCPLGLAPTVSTHIQAMIGDALAVALMEIKEFTVKDFHKYHPGGKLGKLSST